MTKAKKIVVYSFAAVVFVICILIIADNANAGGIHIDNSTHNYPTEVIEIRTETHTITSGLSDEDLASGLATSGASGGHQFSFQTHKWQGSIVGAWYDDEDAVSFGVGKRWEKVDALFHGSFTQNGDDELVVIGGTFRF